MQLENLNKDQLLKIICTMKKKELISIIQHNINNKIGGENNNSNIIKESPNAVRKKIIFDKNKLSKDNTNTYQNNRQYNKIYVKNNK